ncbi:Galactoside 2-alpha-L-fucosyltransferase 2, partial [Armadillidium vulgare]
FNNSKQKISYRRLKNLKYFFYRCKNAVFVVVSDDKQYCEKYLSAPDVIIAGNGNINDPRIDYTLLTLFDHHIRGLGTFGKTSAFLGKGSAVQSSITNIILAMDDIHQSTISLMNELGANFIIMLLQQILPGSRFERVKAILSTAEELSKQIFTWHLMTSQF